MNNQQCQSQMKNPKYKVGDQVFLKDSAALGFMEPYYISQILSSGNGWQYRFSVRKKSASEQTVGDAVDLRYEAPFIIDEVDLIDACTAATVTVANLRARLLRAEAVHQTICGGGSGS